jgi:hypothetical protein
MIGSKKQNIKKYSPQREQRLGYTEKTKPKHRQRITTMTRIKNKKQKILIVRP